MGPPPYLGRLLGPDGRPAGACFQVAPGVVVTARRLVLGDGATVAGPAGDGPRALRPTLLGEDLAHDLAVLALDRPLLAGSARLAADGPVRPDTDVVVSDASGRWAGDARRGGAGLSRISGPAARVGESGAPVRRLVDDVVLGMVSARHDPADGTVPDTLWVVRGGDIAVLLDRCGVRPERAPAGLPPDDGGADREATSLARPTVALVTALPEEQAAVRAALGGTVVPMVGGDRNRYRIGRMASSRPFAPHVVVTASAVEGGTSRAATLVADLLRSFDSVSHVVMTGIAAGVPRPSDPSRHVRLGDVVVASWGYADFDHVDQLPTGPLPRAGTPPASEFLRRSVSELQVQEELGLRPWDRWIDRVVQVNPRYARPAGGTDELHDAAGAVVPHPEPRLSGHLPDLPKIHHGRIGSSDRSFRDAVTRDEVADRWDLLALEMETKGVGLSAAMGGAEWLAVRGISDYGDRFTTRTWRRYAAAAAAGYVAALLEVTPPIAAAGGQVLRG